jgi:hypothetical protein
MTKQTIIISALTLTSCLSNGIVQAKAEKSAINIHNMCGKEIVVRIDKIHFSPDSSEFSLKTGTTGPIKFNIPQANWDKLTDDTKLETVISIKIPSEDTKKGWIYVIDPKKTVNLKFTTEHVLKTADTFGSDKIIKILSPENRALGKKLELKPIKEVIKDADSFLAKLHLKKTYGMQDFMKQYKHAFDEKPTEALEEITDEEFQELVESGEIG